MYRVAAIANVQSIVRRIWPWMVAIAIFVVAVEVGARVMLARSRDNALRLTAQSFDQRASGRPYRFVPTPYVNYRPTPNFVETTAIGATTHNEYGFRGRAWNSTKEEDTLRVVCLGGSTTYDTGVADDRDTYAAQLESNLNIALKDPDNVDAARSGWLQAEVLNLGVGGYTSAEVLVTLHFYALPLKPDIVLIESAINDVAPRFMDEFDYGYAHFRKVWSNDADGIVERLAEHSRFVLWAGFQLGIIQPPTLESRTRYPLPSFDIASRNFAVNGADAFRRNIEAAVVLIQSAGAKPWLLTQSYLDVPSPLGSDSDEAKMEALYKQGQAQHNEILRAIAKVRLVDLIDLGKELPPKSANYVDPIHMTREGNAVRADLIAKQLLMSLPARKRS